MGPGKRWKRATPVDSERSERGAVLPPARPALRWLRSARLRARARSSNECAADSDTRSRDVPTGTVGGRIAGTLSRARRARASPRASRVVAADHERLHDRVRIDRLPARVAQQRARAGRSARREMRASRVAFVARDHLQAGRYRVRDGRRRGRREDVAARAGSSIRSRSRARSRTRPRRRRPAERADVHEMRRERSAAAARRAAALRRHAEAVRIVDDEPRAVAFGQRDEFGERREVAIHAEHRVADDQFRFGIRCVEQCGERGRVRMRMTCTAARAAACRRSATRGSARPKDRRAFCR